MEIRSIFIVFLVGPITSTLALAQMDDSKCLRSAALAILIHPPIEKKTFSAIPWVRNKLDQFKKSISRFNWNFQTPDWIKLRPPDDAAVLLDHLWHDAGRFEQWSMGLLEEALMDLKNQGTNIERPVPSRQLAKALDSVLLSRAIKHGFEINIDRPFSLLLPESSKTFDRRLKDGQYFYDYGVDLITLPFIAPLSSLSFLNAHRHTMRGHGVQTIYAADNIPNFIAHYRELGNSNIWDHYFDNLGTNDLRSPGTGVRLLRPLFDVHR